MSLSLIFTIQCNRWCILSSFCRAAHKFTVDSIEIKTMLSLSVSMPLFVSLSPSSTHTHTLTPVNDLFMLCSAASEGSSWTKQCLTQIWPALLCTPRLSTVSRSICTSSSFTLNGFKVSLFDLQLFPPEVRTDRENLVEACTEGFHIIAS